MRLAASHPRTLSGLIPLAFLALLVSACASTASGASTGNSTASSSAPTPTATPTKAAPPPTATPPHVDHPVTACSQLSQFAGNGAAFAGANFSDIGFLPHSVSHVAQTFEDTHVQFQIIAACSAGVDAAAVRNYFLTNDMPGHGWSQVANYPYHGNPANPCGDPYCWLKSGGTTAPGRWVSLESASTVSGVATYELRLALTGLNESGTIQGTYQVGFELANNDDVWWDRLTTTTSQMVPQGSARIVNLGVTSFTGVTYAHLRGLTYGAAAIPGSQIVVGDVFAVRDNEGNYVKVLVQSVDPTSNYKLTIQWVVYLGGF